jgi:phenylacetate-CoA ligase
VPWYRNVVSSASIDARDITLENFSSVFDVLSKDTLRDNTKEFISEDACIKKKVFINTSGTSGTPLRIAASAESIQYNYAFFSRVLGWAGVKLGDRSATFAGRVFIPSRQKGPPYWRNNTSLNNILFSSYNISERTIPAYIEALSSFNPVYIDSYPSAIYEISKYINENMVAHAIRPMAIITSSETLHDYQRSSIEKAFECRVFDHLGSAEMVTLISQCEHGSYHVNPEYGLFEILNHDGRPVQAGSSGELVCTGFINMAMPLIRYSLGDTVSLSESKCGCGRAFPVVNEITGRTDDLIIACDGSKVGRLDPIFKGVEQNIKEAQIVQKEIGKIVINIVPSGDQESVNAKQIVRELRRRTGECMDIRINYLESINKTKAGKFRSVISELDVSDANKKFK